MLICRHEAALFLILTEACSCALELVYFAGKISKNRLVCENAVTLAYYGSCRLLVMGSFHEVVSLTKAILRSFLVSEVKPW